MNIEIANRLVELRKKYGYSQEELASKLGISRQAVSKWERAESSPDTDNLICLAKLYNCSLDDLLKTDQDVNDIIKDKEEQTIEEESEKKNYCNIDWNGIHVKDGDEEVHIDKYGIHCIDGDEELHIGSKFNYHHLNKDPKYLKKKKINNTITVVISLLISIAYIIIGAVWNIWHPTWILFLFIPLIETIGDAIIKKDANIFAFPVLVTIIYLIMGFYFNLWHPGWVVFLFIPVYYTIIPKKKKINVIDDIKD